MAGAATTSQAPPRPFRSIRGGRADGAHFEQAPYLAARRLGDQHAVRGRLAHQSQRVVNGFPDDGERPRLPGRS
jgi:hypothetical protein